MTLKEHYEKIQELLNNRPWNEEYECEMEVYEVIEYYEKNYPKDGLEDYEKVLLKSYVSYLCVIDDPWY